MTKLTALTTFLLALDLFAAEQMESVVDDLAVVPAGRPGEVNQVVVCELNYTGALFVERYPHAAVPAHVLFSQISSWLLQQDSDRAAFDYSVTVDVLDSVTADIEIRIPFQEQVTATQDIDGALLFNGQRYTIDV